jgi:hypothetical protein
MCAARHGNDERKEQDAHSGGRRSEHSQSVVAGVKLHSEIGDSELRCIQISLLCSGISLCGRKFSFELSNACGGTGAESVGDALDRSGEDIKFGVKGSEVNDGHGGGFLFLG